MPLCPDLAGRLRRCRETLAGHAIDRQPVDAFFPRADGHRPLRSNRLYEVFREVLDLAQIPHLGRGRGPRLHDPRHAFAVFRLLSWYEAGADLRVKLPLLATYLGHVGLAITDVAP